ncbi:MAG: C25 family cysteine peptidase, partial [candidate division Zixibacteria bacterium]|nr:C25 family cysteine peptidase [candidate division Zixibacteria bacterium]
MKKFSLSIYLLLSLFFLCATAWAQMESYSDIQVISSDESGITFNYLVPELKTRKVTSDKESFELVDIDKCAISQEPGEPRLPVKIVSLGIPLGSEVEVSVSDMETVKRAIDIAPVPVIEEDQTDKLGYKYHYAPASKVYAKDSFFPEGIIVAKPPIFIRNQRVVKLLIFPVQFNPQSKTAQVHKNITIRVNFIGGQKEKGVMAGRDLFENIYKKILLNYEQAKSWRRGEEEKRILFKPAQNPFDYSNKWYKIKIAEDGIYCLTKADLSNAGITGDIVTAEIRIFNGGGRALPLSNDSTYLELKEIPLWIKDRSIIGIFDSGDSLFFYGWSCSGWDYDSSKKEFVYSSHPYDSLNTFWLNCEEGFPNLAKRMQTKQNISGNPDTTVLDFKSREHIEYNSDILKTDGEGHITNYQIWYWYKQNYVSQNRFFPDLVVGDTNRISIKASLYVSSLNVNGYSADKIGTESTVDSDRITKFQSDDFNEQTLQALNIYFSGSAYFDWYEVEYWRWLKFQNNYLFFESPDKEGIVEYDISNANDTLIFDISDRFEVKRIAGVELDAGDTIKFRDNVASNQKVQYYALESNRIKKPVGIYRDEYSTWKDDSHQANMVIITPEIFYEQLASLTDFRRTYNQFSVERVKLQDIYDEFSGGLTDPLAIRNFLKYTFNNWSEAPAFVLLAGDGHYDHKNYMGTNNPIRIPCFTAYSDSSWPVSDEYYVYFGVRGSLDPDANGEVDMVISRLPVSSNEELETVLQKVIDYEETPSFGPWKNKITLVADDEFGQISTETKHTEDSENLAENYIPRVFDISKIYLMEYPFNSVGQKPGANQAIIEAFDQGTLMMNWMGHGGPGLWAHEHVLNKGDVPRLSSNNRRLPLVFAATCEVGYFMNPIKQSLGEDLFNAANKGVSAVIAASSLVYPEPNFEINRLFYENVL